jgi:hypothetical protein
MNNRKPNSWFNPVLPAMIMIGDTLAQRPISKLDNRLQDSDGDSHEHLPTKI